MQELMSFAAETRSTIKRYNDKNDRKMEILLSIVLIVVSLNCASCPLANFIVESYWKDIFR
jgi:hypothetical protein